MENDILKSAKDYISKTDWIFAKTYKTAPHEYSLRRAKPELETEFINFVLYIRSEGHDEEFLGRSYRYADIDGYKYWTMGASVVETDLINRAKL